MTYFHIGDLVELPHKMMTREEYERYFKEAGTLVNRAKRYVKSSLKVGNSFEKLSYLLSNFQFVSLLEAAAQIDWEKVPTKNV